VVVDVTVATLVACGSSKRNEKSIAWDLYTSTLFEKSWTAGMYLGDPYVMSAKHNLVRGDERLETYNKSLNNQTAEWRKHWGRDVVKELPRMYDEVVLLGGRNYVEPIVDAISFFDRVYEVHDPYQCTSGNGQQMRVADRIVEARSACASVPQALSYATKPYRGEGQ